MKRFIFAMLALLLLAGVGAWLVFADGADSAVSLSQSDSLNTSEASAAKQGELARAAKAEARRIKAALAAEDLSAKARANGESPDGNIEGGSNRSNARGNDSTNQGTSSDASTRSFDADKNSTSGSSGAGGRAGLIDTLTFIAAGKEADEVADDELEILASKKWTPERVSKRFANRGAEAPKRILTELSGKIMVHGINTGLPAARVILHSFFPEHNVPTDQLIPVITEFTTDEKGNFNGMVPLPERFPETHAVLTITVICGAEGGNQDIKIQGPEMTFDGLWNVNGKAAMMDGTYGIGRPLIVGKALTQVVAGKKAALGIFWVSEHTVNLRLDGTAFQEKERTSATVTMTGHTDPKRWTTDTKRETLATFPSRTLNLSKMSQVLAVADTSGGWIYDGPPVLVLHQDGEVLSTQRANITKKEVEKFEERSGAISPLDGKTYILDVFFDGGSGTSISGYVQNAEELGIGGARVYFGGKSVNSVISEPNGWFFLGNAPSDTKVVVVEHPDYVARWINVDDFRKANNLAVMSVLRPRVTLRILDEATQLPLATVRANFDYKNAWNQAKKGEMDLPKKGDDFLFEWQDQVTSKIEISADGYTAVKIDLPKQNNPNLVEVRLRERRLINVRPVDFAEAETGQDSRWFTLSDGSDDVYTAWSYLDLSYDVNFSKDVYYDEEEQPVPFEFVLGLRNQGIVDNVYEFEVDVLLDGKVKGRLKIRADSLNERSGALNLGPLKGQHRITLRWRNDKWIPNELDANIRVCFLRFLELP